MRCAVLDGALGARMRRRSLLLCVAAWAGAVSLSGQAPQPPVFRGGVSLVRVDVTVVDHDGKPVPGLTADDFDIKLDGRVEPVRTVDFEATPTTHAVSATAEHQATNTTPVATPRIVVMLVDDLMITGTRDKDLFFAASKFVSGLPATDWVGFATTSGSAAINPTRDHGAVEVGLRHAVGQLVDPRSLPPDVAVGLDEAVEIGAGNQTMLLSVVGRDCWNGQMITANDLQYACGPDVEAKARGMGALIQRTTDMQMASYRAVLNAMRTVPGQKVLVILSDGLLLTTYGGQRQGADLVALEQAAAAAGVHLSVLFGNPDAVSMTTRSSAEDQARRDDGQALMQGVQTLADATGGDFYRVMGQPDRFFGFVTDAMSGVYHLGIEAPAGSASGRDFKLTAGVKRSDVTVRANRVALLAAPAPPVPVDTQLQTAVTKGEPTYAVPIVVGTVIRPGRTDGEITLGANVEVPASVPGPLTVMFGLVDAKGKLRMGKNTLAAPAGGGDYRLSLSLPVPVGSYRLRFGIADARGQVGSLDMAVAGQLNRLGPLLASDILTAWSGPDGKSEFLALGKVPATATALQMALQLTQAPGAVVPSDVRVTWTIVSEAGQTVTEQTVTPVSAADRLNAQAQIAVASLPAGTYELRATILVGIQAVGATSMTFRKADSGDECSTPLESCQDLTRPVIWR
jgi:VWFA-related protein